MTTTTPKPREGQVAGFPKEQAVMLTESNAYRAKSIRRTGTDEVPVLFHFRKRCMGMHSYVHTIEATDGIEKVIRPADFKEWEIVECRYPGYLEDLYDSACSAYRWNSFDPAVTVCEPGCDRTGRLRPPETGKGGAGLPEQAGGA